MEEFLSREEVKTYLYKLIFKEAIEAKKIKKPNEENWSASQTAYPHHFVNYVDDTAYAWHNCEVLLLVYGEYAGCRDIPATMCAINLIYAIEVFGVATN